MTDQTEVKTFALVQGFCHEAWHWNFLKSELEQRGHQAVTFDLPITDPNGNFDSYGSVIAEALEGKENIVGVFHSRAGNYGPRAFNTLLERNGKIAVQRMVFLHASFEADTLHALGRPKEDENVPARNSAESRKAIVAQPGLGRNMRAIDPTFAEEFLYHDVEDKDIVKRAIRHLKPQNRPDIEPKMDVWPNLPQNYIIGTDDRMVRPEWSRYIAETWLDIKPVLIPTGHSSFLSQPALLANLLDNISKNENRVHIQVNK